MRLWERIAKTHPEPGELAVFYLAQAGFLYKTATGTTVCVDPYLGDCCERFFGFKRMVPTPILIDEIQADVFAATHSHNDHLDPDLLSQVKLDVGTRFVGAPDCLPVFREAGVADERVTILATGQGATVEGVGFRAVHADHGDLAPDAVGFLIDLGGITVYHTGDTGYCPDAILESLGDARVEIMVAPINPAFGNLGPEDAAKLAAVIRPRIVVGCHFGMFVEHGGDPAAFLEYAKKAVPESTVAMVMAPGERMVYTRELGIKEMETQKGA